MRATGVCEPNKRGVVAGISAKEGIRQRDSGVATPSNGRQPNLPRVSAHMPMDSVVTYPCPLRPTALLFYPPPLNVHSQDDSATDVVFYVLICAHIIPPRASSVNHDCGRGNRGGCNTLARSKTVRQGFWTRQSWIDLARREAGGRMAFNDASRNTVTAASGWAT